MLLHINVICDNTHINNGHRALIYPTGYIIISPSLNIQILNSTKLTATGNLSLYLTGARAFVNGLQNVLILAAASHKLLILQLSNIDLSNSQSLIGQLLHIGGQGQSTIRSIIRRISSIIILLQIIYLSRSACFIRRSTSATIIGICILQLSADIGVHQVYANSSGANRSACQHCIHISGFLGLYLYIICISIAIIHSCGGLAINIEHAYANSQSANSTSRIRYVLESINQIIISLCSKISKACTIAA